MRPSRDSNLFLWKYFVKNDNKSVICTICLKKLNSSGNIIMHMSGHLRRNHSSLLKKNVLITKLKKKMAQNASPTSDHLMEETADNPEVESSGTSTVDLQELQDEEIFGNLENTTLDCEFIQALRENRNLKQSFRDEREVKAYKLMKKATQEISARNEFCTFGSFVADNVKKLKPINQIWAKRQITNMIMDLQIKEMETCEEHLVVELPETSFGISNNNSNSSEIENSSYFRPCSEHSSSLDNIT